MLVHVGRKDKSNECNGGTNEVAKSPRLHIEHTCTTQTRTFLGPHTTSGLDTTCLFSTAEEKIGDEDITAECTGNETSLRLCNGTWVLTFLFNIQLEYPRRLCRNALLATKAPVVLARKVEEVLPPHERMAVITIILLHIFAIATIH